MAETNGTSGSPATKTWKCKDCKISFPDVYAYTDHLESKAHIKSVMKNKYGEKYLEAKAKLESKFTDGKPKSGNENPKSKEKEAKSTDSSDGSSDEDEEVYTCEVCKKVCTGYVSYQLHLQGKKHQKTLLKLKLLSEMKKQQILPEPQNEPKEESLLDKIMTKNHYASSDIVCQVCNKSCPGPEVYKQHCKSKAHKKKLLRNDVVKGIDSLGLAQSPKPNDESENFAYCEVCQKGFSGPIPYMQHLESAVHLKQAKQVGELDKIKDLIISTEEDSKFQCKECGKMFSGIIPFQNHLKSSVHGKLKKKSTLLESLEAKHPEMFKGSAVLNSDDENSDNDVLLGCEVCHRVFTGPEAARDHFISLKHKKAVKQKAQFKKYKSQVKQGKLMEAAPKMKQREETLVSKNIVDSDCDSEEFDVIPNP